MREKIDCFLPCYDPLGAAKTVAQLRGSKTIQNIFLLTSGPLPAEDGDNPSKCIMLTVDNLTSSNTLMTIAENARSEERRVGKECS